MDALKLGLFIQSLPPYAPSGLGRAVLKFLAEEAVDPLGPVTAAEEQRLRIKRQWQCRELRFQTPRSWAAMARVFSRENTEPSISLLDELGCMDTSSINGIRWQDEVCEAPVGVKEAALAVLRDRRIGGIPLDAADAFAQFRSVAANLDLPKRKSKAARKWAKKNKLPVQEFNAQPSSAKDFLGMPTFGSPGMGKSATINRMYHQLSEQEQSRLKEAHKLGLVEFLDPFDGTWYPKLTAHFALGTAYRIKWPQVWEVRYWSLTQRQKDILRFAAKCGLCIQYRTNDSAWHVMNTDDGGIWQNSLIYRIHPQDLTT